MVFTAAEQGLGLGPPAAQACLRGGCPGDTHAGPFPPWEGSRESCRVQCGSGVGEGLRGFEKEVVETRVPSARKAQPGSGSPDYMRGRPASWAAGLRKTPEEGAWYLLRMARIQGRVRTPISHTCPCRRPTLPEPLGCSPWENRAGRVHLPGKLRPGPWSSPRGPSGWLESVAPPGTDGPGVRQGLPGEGTWRPEAQDWQGLDQLLYSWVQGRG